MEIGSGGYFYINLIYPNFVWSENTVITISQTGTSLDGVTTTVLSSDDNPIRVSVAPEYSLVTYGIPNIPTLTGGGVQTIIIGIPIDGTMFVYNAIGFSTVSAVVELTGTEYDDNTLSNVAQGSGLNDVHFSTSSYTATYVNPNIPFASYGDLYGSRITSIVTPDTAASYDLADEIHTTPAIDSSNNIYVTDYGGNITIFSTTLSQLNQLGLGDNIVSSPVVSADGLTVYFGTLSNNVYAIPVTPPSGEDFGYGLITYTTDGPIVGSPIVDSVNKNIIIGNTNGSFYSINFGPITYIPLWSYEFGGGDDTPGDMAIGGDGTVYVAVNSDNGGYVNAFTPDGNNFMGWSAPDGDNTMSSPAIGSTGTLYVASESGVSAFN
jgi:hypothetical protein